MVRCGAGLRPSLCQLWKSHRAQISRLVRKSSAKYASSACMFHQR